MSGDSPNIAGHRRVVRELEKRVALLSIESHEPRVLACAEEELAAARKRLVEHQLVEARQAVADAEAARNPDVVADLEAELARLEAPEEDD